MIRLFIFFVVFLSPIFAKEVLILHSYQQSYRWSVEISEGIESVIKDGRDLKVYTEYMFARQVGEDPEYFQTYRKLFERRFKNKEFDIVIASDNVAFSFALDNHDTLFKNSKILFCGVNNFDEEQIKNHPARERITGVVEYSNIYRNIELMRNFNPQLEKIIIINDKTVTGKAIGKDFLAIKDLVKEVELEYIDNRSLEDLRTYVRSQNPKTTAVLFFILFKDEKGHRYSYKDAVEYISKNSPVPIYGVWSFYFEHGIVGGLLTYGKNQGLEVAKMAKQILQGEDVKNIPILTKSPNRYIFDYKKLKEYRLPLNRVPINATIVNKPVSYYEKHKSTILISTFIILVLIGVIVSQGLNISLRRKAENELSSKLHLIEVLLDAIDQPIVYKDIKGKYAGFNRAFKRMVGSDREGILGKSSYDFFDQEFAKKNVETERKLLQDGGSASFEGTYIDNITSEKREILIHKAVYKIDDRNFGGVVTIISDITTLKKIEKERELNEKFLVQQSKLVEIGEMLAAIAHQWNEPLVELSAIVQDLELSYSLGEIDRDSMTTFVDESMKQIQYMSETLKSFRKFLKPTSQKENFYLERSFSEIMEIIKRSLQYNNIDVNINLQEDYQLYGYPNEFKQVLLNVINNARDAINKERERSKKDFDGVIEVTAKKELGHVRINIKDNGCGIKKNDIAQIFEFDFSTKPDGNGIGLYMAKIIVEGKMNGTIMAESKTEGTTFMITVPTGETNENSLT